MVIHLLFGTGDDKNVVNTGLILQHQKSFVFCKRHPKALPLKVSPIETLRKIKVGDKRLVRQRDIDAAVVRSTVCKLNSTGCKYDLKAHIEGTVVKRLK